MAKTYEQVLKQIESLKGEAEKLRRKEIDGVVARIREAIAHYGLTASDLGLATRARKAAAPAAKPRAAKKAAKKGKGSVPPKYRDDAGHTWTGRGLKPVWLRDALAAGRTLKDFEIK
ncbi:MAG: H-NS histone family protein [Rubrivivax sp.]